MTMIGVLGGGQLGRMMALAGLPLGLRFRFLDPDSSATAREVGEHVVARFEDRAALARFARGLSAVTYETENVPVDVALELSREVPVYPPPAALEASQDRLVEKSFFRRHGLETAPFVAVESDADLREAAAELGFPCILKTRRFGYDGKGQFLLRSAADLEPAFRAIGGAPLILEGFVRFERELSLVAVRGRDGATAFYPLVENHHERGILSVTYAPAPRLNTELQTEAENLMGRLLSALDYVGVLTIEFFERGGQLIANEMAPRVHNSGHWTIEGAATSQFENHVRAVVGWPLGSVKVSAPCAMLNIIGAAPESSAVLAAPDAHLHLYGKTPRGGRKLGHVTVRAESSDELRKRTEVLETLVNSVRKLEPPSGDAVKTNTAAGDSPRP